MSNFALAVTPSFSNKTYDNVMKNLLQTGNLMLLIYSQNTVNKYSKLF